MLKWFTINYRQAVWYIYQSLKKNTFSLRNTQIWYDLKMHRYEQRLRVNLSRLADEGSELVNRKLIGVYVLKMVNRWYYDSTTITITK